MDAIAPGRLAAYHEVFPVAFIFQNYPGRDFSMPGLELRSLEIDSGSVSRDLLAVIGEVGDGLRVAFRHRTDLFEPETVDRLIDDYLEILTRFPEDRERRLSELVERLPAGSDAALSTEGGT
jgi:non-ribosomal peptide synthetase component F